MKRAIVIILLIVCLFLMTSCGKTATESSNVSGFFTEICSFGGAGSFTHFVYDPFTNIVYVQISGAYHTALSPYYIIENGQPVIAQYNINWTMDEIK